MWNYDKALIMETWTYLQNQLRVVPSYVGGAN
jgi:hypothetical protein